MSAEHVEEVRGWLNDPSDDYYFERFREHFAALLDALEAAERERDEAYRVLGIVEPKRHAAEALVHQLGEALDYATKIVKMVNAEDGDDEALLAEVASESTEALAAYHQFLGGSNP
jgi:hypothetical protein